MITIKLLKTNILLFFCLVGLAGCYMEKTGDQNQLSEREEEVYNEYQNYVSSFDEVTTQELNFYEEEQESFFLYAGRVTCPHCRVFVPKLYNVSLQSNINSGGISIRYLNTENDNDTTMNSYREKHNIEYVPYFSYFEGGVLIESLRIHDDMTMDQISDFIATFISSAEQKE